MNHLAVDKDSSLYVYQPFIGIFRLVGAMPVYTGKAVPYNQWLFCESPFSWHSVAYAIQHFILIHYIFRCFYHVGDEDFWPIAVEFLRAFASIFTVHIFTRYNTTFHQLLREMDLVKGSAVENLRMGKLTRRNLGLCVFYIVVRCLLDMMRVVAPKLHSGHSVNFTESLGNETGHYSRFFPAPTRLEEYAKNNWYGADLSAFDGATIGFLTVYGALEVSLFRVLVSGSFAFALTLYCTMCHHFKIKYQYFNEEIEDLLYRRHNRGRVTSEMMMTYRHTLALLAQAVTTMDTFFNKSTFLWFTMFLSGFCAEITALFSEVGSEKKVQDDPLVELNVTFDGAYLLFWFFNISVRSSSVFEEATRSIRPFHHLASREPHDDVDFALQARLLFSQLHDIKVGLTAWNFFIINRAAILTIGGALITYLIVVIQMNPQATSMLITATTSQGNDTLDVLD